jgi:hypothetical protein
VKPPLRGQRKRNGAKPHFFGARGRLPPLNDFDFDFDFFDFDFDFDFNDFYSLIRR